MLTRPTPLILNLNLNLSLSLNLNLLFLVLFLLPVARAQEPSYYRRLGSWHESAQASFEAIALHRQAAGPAAPVSFVPWQVAGPFRSSSRDAFAESFPPEHELTLHRRSADSTIKWTPRPEWNDGMVILFPPSDYSAWYLSRTVSASHDTVVALSLGSDDGIKVWLDGKAVFQHDTYRGAAPDQESVDIRLTAGTHRLMLKVNNGTGPSGFYFAMSDYAAKAVWALLRRDFSSPEDQQEIDWETEDSIWARPWRPGENAELTQRYTAVTLYDTPEERELAIEEAVRLASPEALAAARSHYLASRRAEITPEILTPKPSDTPRINGPAIFGVRPGHPLLYTIPATGARPMEFSVRDLPQGLTVESATGRMTGSINIEGRYNVTLVARNRLGTAEKPFTIVVGPAIALTPPLGWNSWNCFAASVDDAKIRSAADGMVASGLIHHGWTYINIDDCWEIKPGSKDTMLAGDPRTAEGRIMTNRKFPDMKSLSDYVHGKGLKLGIYSSPGPLTCAGFTASYGYERQDAEQFVDWGIDYLKYDWCSYGTIERGRTPEPLQKPYRTMRRELDRVPRDIVYSLCQYGMGDVWTWGADVGGNCWRTTGDIEDTWESMSRIGFSQAGHEKYAGPGGWNDPDMLVVGYVGWGPHLHPTRLTPNEQYTHITLWSLLCSPLLIGCDLSRLDEFTLSLLTNDEVLAVNQDVLGEQAARVRKDGDRDVWGKRLADGSMAVGLFNRGMWKESLSVNFSALGLKGPQRVRDLWRQKEIGTFEAAYTATVPRHGAVLVKLTPN
ncbi:MAG: putative Ig domain-containing protein [Bacteroidota bacterium]